MASTGELPSERLTIINDERKLIYTQKILNWSIKQLTYNEKNVVSLHPKFIIKQKPKQIDIIAAIQTLKYYISKCIYALRYEKEFCRPSAIADQKEVHRVGTMIQKLINADRLSRQRNHKSSHTEVEINILKSVRKKNVILPRAIQ